MISDPDLQATSRRLKLAVQFRQSIALVVLAAALALGCHSDIAPVSGRVTLNGQPLVGAVVTFQPLGTRDAPRPAGLGSTGKTDSNGRFSLRLVKPDQAGAVVGDHSVTITPPASESDSAAGKPPAKVPEVWRDGSRMFHVPRGGTSKADFDITYAEPPLPTKKKRK